MHVLSDRPLLASPQHLRSSLLDPCLKHTKNVLTVPQITRTKGRQLTSQQLRVLESLAFALYVVPDMV